MTRGLRFDLNNPEDRKILEKMGKRTGRDLVGEIVREQNKSSLSDKVANALNDENPRRQDKQNVKRAKALRPQERNYERTDRTMSFTFPMPPTTNDMFIPIMFKGRATLVPSKQAKEYKVNVAELAEQQGAFLMSGTIRFTMHVFRKTRRGDVSNRIKIVEDALTGIAYYDDEQVAEIHLYRHLSRKNPRVEILLEQIK